MKQTIIIKNGAEYVCLQSDIGNCEPSCPNLITQEGFLLKEAVMLSRQTTNYVCALKEKVKITNSRRFENA